MLPPAAAAIAPADTVLQDLLAVSLTGIIFYTPVYDPAGSGEIIDFTFEYLNPTAQRMMGMPEVPTLTHMGQWPHSKEHGTFQFHVEAFVSGEPREYNINYQADGYDNYYRLAARRSGSGLLVSFTDTADQPRSPVEIALREAQAAEQAARADAEDQRQRFYDVLMQLPAHVAVHEGPDQVFALVNPYYQRIANGRELFGQPIRTVWHELADQGILDELDRVYRTGEPFTATELPVRADFTRTGQLEEVYYNFFFLALRDAQGQINGVLNYSYDVTASVRARQQVEQLNQALEARVQEHTRVALVAQADALTTAQRLAHEREAFYHVFEQTPALIALLRAPAHRFEYVNPAYQGLFPGRQLVGLDLAVAVPELQAQGYVEVLDRVYQTGETFLGEEVPFAPSSQEGQPARARYYNFTYQAYREAGAIAGISIFAYDVTEQVLARQEREVQRQRLHDLFMQAPAAICILDGPNLVYELVNPGYQALFPGRQLHGRPLLDALPEIAGHAVYHTFRQVYETGATHAEMGILIPLARPGDGVLEERYFNYIQQARRDEHGRINGELVFAFEVTEQVVARQKAEESGEELKRYKFMADRARDAFILMRQDGSFAYLNTRALEAWGYTAKEARHLRVPDVDPLHDEAAYARLFETAQHAHPGQFETLHRRKDGHVFPVEVSLAGLQLGGEPHLLAVARDITQQQRTLAELRESEARFRIMADAAPNHVWAVHPDSTIRYVNRAFLDFVGVSLEEYVAVGWSAFMHPDELAGAQQALEAAIEARGMYVLEHRMRRHDGEYRWLLAQGAPSFFPNGELYGYVGSAIDITELKQTNEQLRRSNVDLDNFIYTASHDLKAPISNIEGLLQTLQDELPPPSQSTDVAHILHLMQDSVDRFTRTIEHLTDVSKLQKEHNQPTAPVPLARVIEDVRLDLAPLQQQTGGRLDVDVQAVPTVRFSEKNLRSVVFNLLSNALKYRHPDRAPEVRVRSRAEGDYCVLEVQDNGLGLDLTRERDLFEMFRRYHTHVAGSGIGLYMVKRMVENAGGRIAVHSAVGQGSTFTVYFPC